MSRKGEWLHAEWKGKKRKEKSMVVTACPVVQILLGSTVDICGRAVLGGTAESHYLLVERLFADAHNNCIVCRHIVATPCPHFPFEKKRVQ